MFTQLLWSNATAVGCGATRYVNNGVYWFVIACDYSSGNIDGLPVYVNSTNGGSGCINGTDVTYKSLCKNQLDGSNNSSTPDGSSATNFTSKDYCKTNCGARHVACNATDVRFQIT